MNFSISGLGVWSRGLCSYDDLSRCVSTGVIPADAEFEMPLPQAIPARERRRAGLMINLAVTVAHQACEHAGVNKSQVPSVFTSAMGDTDITDYMCRRTAQPLKLLSPTKFHNSVQNAPSGYWSISAENRAPSTFVGGYVNSFGMGLLEAASQARAMGGPVLLVAYDIANNAPFSDVTPIRESFACALVLAPTTGDDEACSSADNQDGKLGVQSTITLMSGQADLQKPKSPALAELASANPAAAGLTLFEQIVRVQNGEAPQARVQLSASRRSHLSIELLRV
jgi:hypothetical protein